MEAALEPLHLHHELPEAAVQEAVEASESWKGSPQEAPSELSLVEASPELAEALDQDLLSIQRAVAYAMQLLMPL